MKVFKDQKEEINSYKKEFEQKNIFDKYRSLYHFSKISFLLNVVSMLLAYSFFINVVSDYITNSVLQICISCVGVLVLEIFKVIFLNRLMFEILVEYDKRVAIPLFCIVLFLFGGSIYTSTVGSVYENQNNTNVKVLKFTNVAGAGIDSINNVFDQRIKKADEKAQLFKKENLVTVVEAGKKVRVLSANSKTKNTYSDLTNQSMLIDQERRKAISIFSEGKAQGETEILVSSSANENRMIYLSICIECLIVLLFCFQKYYRFITKDTEAEEETTKETTNEETEETPNEETKEVFSSLAPGDIELETNVAGFKFSNLDKDQSEYLLKYEKIVALAMPHIEKKQLPISMIIKETGKSRSTIKNVVRILKNR